MVAGAVVILAVTGNPVVLLPVVGCVLMMVVMMQMMGGMGGMGGNDDHGGRR